MTAKLREAQERGARLVELQSSEHRAAAAERASEHRAVAEEVVADAPRDSGVSAQEAATAPESLLEALLSDMFQKADVDGNGVLDAAEFAQVLHAPALGLRLEHGQTAKLMEAVDRDGNGRVDWREFVTVFQKLLQEMSSDSQRQWPALALTATAASASQHRCAPRVPARLHRHLLLTPSHAEPTRPPFSVSSACTATWVELYSPEEDTMIYYNKLEGAVRVELPGDANVCRSIYKQPADEFERLALRAFISSDMLGRGCLDGNEVTAALRSSVLALGLSEEDESVYLEMCNGGDAGRKVDYEGFLSVVRQCLATKHFCECLCGNDGCQLCAFVPQSGVPTDPRLSRAGRGATVAAAAPRDSGDWLPLDSASYGVLHYHRVTGVSRRP